MLLVIDDREIVCVLSKDDAELHVCMTPTASYANIWLLIYAGMLTQLHGVTDLRCICSNA